MYGMCICGGSARVCTRGGQTSGVFITLYLFIYDLFWNLTFYWFFADFPACILIPLIPPPVFFHLPSALATFPQDKIKFKRKERKKKKKDPLLESEVWHSKSHNILIWDRVSHWTWAYWLARLSGYLVPRMQLSKPPSAGITAEDYPAWLFTGVIGSSGLRACKGNTLLIAPRTSHFKEMPH